MATTPNMSLTQPTVGVTAGSTGAQNLVDAEGIIDAHDHSPGRGPRVPTAGLNLNADTPLNGHKLTTVNGVVFNQVAITDAGGLYVGPTGDLYFIDGAANVIRLTINGGLNLASANFTSDVDLGGHSLIGAGSVVPTNNAGAIATLLALYIRSGVLKWNDANGTVLTLASAYAVDPPTLTVATGNVALSQTSGDQIVLVDTSAQRTITLPPPANFKKRIWVKDKTGTASAFPILIARNASEKIEGVAATLSYNGNWGGVCLVTDGTDWFSI